MKLNFWQWLGLILLVVGLLLVAYKRMGNETTAPGGGGLNAPSASPSSPGGAP